MNQLNREETIKGWRRKYSEEYRVEPLNEVGIEIRIFYFSFFNI